ncbi:hypothetical protein [Endozoicomonas ascidiicola]|uniref:hypothetical protein n=1 Tax=Endozoicomonas ascidiicola TaxID=1698521 RepID=UPI00082DF7F2|nr:hypothetical protein [Endozoicomonas ascidiicola]
MQTTADPQQLDALVRIGTPHHAPFPPELVVERIAQKAREGLMAQKLALNIGIGATVNSSLGKSFEQAQKESTDLGRNYEKINKQLARTREVKKYESQLKKLNQRIAQGNGDTLAMARVKEKLEKQLKQSQRAAKNAGVDIRNLAREEERLGWQAKQTEKHQEALNRSMAKTARMEKLRGVGRSAMGYGQGTMVGRGVSAMGGSAGLAGGMGLAATGIGAVGLAAGAAATAGFAATVRMAETLDVIGKRADQLGVTTKALQELQYAADRTGMGGEEMIDALQDQAEKISEAAMLGSGEAVDVLAALNLNAAELNQLSPDQQIMKIADAMESVKNQNDKQQLAIKLWGGSAAKMVNTIKGGSEALKGLMGEADIIPDEVIRNSESFGDALLDIKKTFGAVFAMVMGPALPWLTERMEELRAWMKSNQDGIEAFSSGAGKLFSVLFRIGGLIYKTMAPGFKLLWAIISPIVETLGSMIEMLVTASEKVVEFRDGFFGNIPVIGGLFGGDDTEAAGGMPQRKPVGGNNTTYSSQNSMVIQTQPGQDPEQIGSIVMQKIEERDRQQARQFRGSMFDMTPATI